MLIQEGYSLPTVVGTLSEVPSIRDSLGISRLPALWDQVGIILKGESNKDSRVWDLLLKQVYVCGTSFEDNLSSQFMQ